MAVLSNLKDVLNRLLIASETHVANDEDGKSDTKRLEADARHLSKYMFPRQYKLENVFTVWNTQPYPQRSAHFIKDYTDRESEIKVFQFLLYVCRS